jgi:hypothetical protein
MSSRTYISILRTLDFTQVGLSVKLNDSAGKRYMREPSLAYKKSGLEPVQLLCKGPVQALVVLTLDPIPLSDGSPDKVLYDKKSSCVTTSLSSVIRVCTLKQ